MRGTLHKTEQGWIVNSFYETPLSLPVHPDYVKYYFLDEDAEGAEVEFEIIEEFKDRNAWYHTYQKYARLTKPKPNIDLQNLETKLDQALSEETDWTLNKWLKSKREQKEMLSEIMNEDAKDGLYDTNTPMVERLKEHLDSITPEQFEQEIEYIRKDLEIEDVAMNGPQYIPEISDEEILKAANNPNNDGYSFIEGAKWYRQQLKNR